MLHEEKKPHTTRKRIHFILTCFMFGYLGFVIASTINGIKDDQQQDRDTLAMITDMKQTCTHDPCFLYEIDSVHELHHDTVSFYVRDYNDDVNIEKGIIPASHKTILTLQRHTLPDDVYTLMHQYVFVYENSEQDLQIDMVQP